MQYNNPSSLGAGLQCTGADQSVPSYPLNSVFSADVLSAEVAERASSLAATLLGSDQVSTSKLNSCSPQIGGVINAAGRSGTNIYENLMLINNVLARIASAFPS